MVTLLEVYPTGHQPYRQRQSTSLIEKTQYYSHCVVLFFHNEKANQIICQNTNKHHKMATLHSNRFTILNKAHMSNF